MNIRFLTGALAIGVAFAPLISAADSDRKSRHSSDMQRAIAWEHHKDAAARRQARLEARHPSVSSSEANRGADREAQPTEGRRVKDPGPNGYRRDH